MKDAVMLNDSRVASQCMYILRIEIKESLQTVVSWADLVQMVVLVQLPRACYGHWNSKQV